MAQLQINLTGLEGLTTRYYGDKSYIASNPNLRYLGTESQVAEGIYNPIATLGYMSPANNTIKNVTGTTPFLLTSAMVVPSTGGVSTDSYPTIIFADEAVTGTTGKIMGLNTFTDTSLSQVYEIPIESSTMYSKSEDLILYQTNGVKRIFFTRTITTDTTGLLDSIGIAESIIWSTPDPDWSISPAAGGGPATLRSDGRLMFVLADNGFLYVMNGNRVHRIDGSTIGGTNGTIVFGVLQFLGSPTAGGTGTMTYIQDAIDLRGRMWIGIHVNSDFDTRVNSVVGKTYNEFVGVFIWDRRSSAASMQDFIPIRGVKELKSLHVFQGQASCFTMSTDGYTQFRVWNGSEMQLVQTLGQDAYPVYRRHSVYEHGDYIMWLGNDGKIYCYGKFEPQLKNALYIVGDMSTHVTGGQTYSGSGVFIPANGVETVTSGAQTSPLAFYLSYTDTGGNWLRKWYPHSVDSVATIPQLAHIGNVYSLVQYFPGLSNVTYGQLIMAPGGSGGSTVMATFKVFLNQSTTTDLSFDITQDDIKRGFKYLPMGRTNVHAIQTKIEWNTSATMSGDRFRPVTLLVDYSPTTKLK